MGWKWGFALILGMVLACSPPFDARENDRGEGYPHWFLKGVREQGVCCAVGYGRFFVDPDTSVAYATPDGVGNVVKGMKVHIRSEQGFMAVPDGLRFMGETFSEKVDSTKVDAIRDDCRVLDSAFVHRMTLVLICCGMEGASKVARGRAPMPGKAPKWTRKLPNNKGYVFAVGTSDLYYYEESSWREAERAARLELARNLLSQIRDLSRQADGTLEHIVVTKTEATLRGMRIVGRWLDSKEKACYVLCRMPNR